MADVFLIHIDGASDFVALVASSEPRVAHCLYLFDHHGYGVLGGSAMLRIARPAAGLYYLGVAVRGVEPYSRVPASGRAMIFPRGEVPQVAVAADRAGGGSHPLAGWCGEGRVRVPGDYFVQLSGARCAPRPLVAASLGAEAACGTSGSQGAERAAPHGLPGR